MEQKRGRGRPRKDVTRDRSVHVRLTSEVYDRLQARADAEQSSVAAVVSLAIERELNLQMDAANALPPHP